MTSSQSLSTYPINLPKFSLTDDDFKIFQSEEFLSSAPLMQVEVIGKHLHQLIHQFEAPCFLLKAVIAYFFRLNSCQKQTRFHFYHFEYWLNELSNLSPDEQLSIRAKIAGKSTPRAEFQALFPIGMNQKYLGHHYVTGHGSPDLDTTIASFWGWLDAFAVKLAEGIHFWNIPPGGLRELNEVTPLTDVFGDSLLDCCAIEESEINAQTYQRHIDLESKANAQKATATVRDFSNRLEVDIQPEVEIISAMDHHKCDIQTKAPATLTVADVQSCNTLLAEQCFMSYLTFMEGYNKADLIKQFEEATKSTELTAQKARLITKIAHKIASKQDRHFVHQDRQFSEYLSFIHAIIDDTDLFSKASYRDVICVAELLNQLQSLSEGKSLEIVSFDELDTSQSNFISKAVEKIVQNKEMYGIYKTIFDKREQAVETMLQDAATGKNYTLFSDAKEQNKCCKISQAKLFTANQKSLEEMQELLVSSWIKLCQQLHERNPKLCFFLHMNSTIPSADEVHKGSTSTFNHQDSIWIWVAKGPQSQAHFDHFVQSFKDCPAVEKNNLKVKVWSEDSIPFAELAEKAFGASNIERLKDKEKAPVVELTFDAGTLNSRKSHITPFLPTL